MRRLSSLLFTIPLSIGLIAPAHVSMAQTSPTPLPARVVIANRTFDRGKALAEELGVDVVRWESLMDARAQIIVHGTSVGMTPKTEESPIAATLFKKDMVVMDTVYPPRNTKFLRDARAAGALGIDGVEMFLRQGRGED